MKHKCELGQSVLFFSLVSNFDLAATWSLFFPPLTQTAEEMPGSCIFSMITSVLFSWQSHSLNRRAFHCVCVCVQNEMHRVVLHVTLVQIPGKPGISVGGSGSPVFSLELVE